VVFIGMKLYIFLKRERIDSFYKQNIFLEIVGGFYKNKTKYLLRDRVGGCYKNKK